VHALGTNPRVSLNGGRATLSGVLDGCIDHRQRDALSPMTAPHRDARDDPRCDIIDGRRRARVRDPGEIVPRSERYEANRLTVLIRDQARRVLPTPRELREGRSALRLGCTGTAAGDAELVLLGGGVARE
jgi:hypothetical protein